MAGARQATRSLADFAHSLNSLARMCVECAVSNLGEVLQLVDTYGSFENVVAKQTDELQGTSLWMVYCS